VSLLFKAGAILIRAGSLVSAAAQACIDACCGNWYCCWSDEAKSYSSCQDTPCPYGMQRSGPYSSDVLCQEPCDVPPEWYCCWDTPEPRGAGATSTCQPTPCDEGMHRSGPYDSEQDCTSPCDLPWAYYCCLDANTQTASCELGYQCPEGYTQVGGPYYGNECNANCYEALGACCELPGFCNDAGECQEAFSYWAKNECGECIEHTQESQGWTKRSCRVFNSYVCDPFAVLGWVSYELCRDNGTVYNSCVDDVPAENCSEPGKTWHPNMACYQVNCPGDCYDTGSPSPCPGSAGESSNGNCQLSFGNWGFACADDIEVTIEISGVQSDAICPLDEGQGQVIPDICAGDPVTDAARSVLASLLNATFTLPKGDPNNGGTPLCAEPLKVCDDSSVVNQGGADLQVIVKAEISLIAEDVSSGSYEPGQTECGHNVCFRVKVDWFVCVHVLEEGPYDCDSFTWCQYTPHACGSVQAPIHAACCTQTSVVAPDPASRCGFPATPIRPFAEISISPIGVWYRPAGQPAHPEASHVSTVCSVPLALTSDRTTDGGRW